MPLPNLVIIGAAKAGTTSLHAYLALHPEVWMAEAKELNLFNNDNWEARLGWYARQFRTGFAVRGESSPMYSVQPARGPTAERMHAAIPEARLVYLVRDPIERMLGHYVEFVHVGYERRSFDEAMADYGSESNMYVMASRYAYQLERYREHFPDSQLLVLDQQDLLLDRSRTLRRVFEFIGVDAHFSTEEFAALHNVKDGKIWPNRAALWLDDRGLLTPLRQRTRVLPTAIRERSKALFTRRVVAPRLEGERLAALRSVFAEDARRVREYSGLALAHWSV